MSKKRFKTPPGVAVFPALYRPDTKFDELGSYKADIRLDPKLPEVKAFLDTLNVAYREATGSAHPKRADSANKRAVYYHETDKEDEPTGFIVVKMRVKNKRKRDTGELWDRRPAQFDAAGKPIANAKKIGGGSVIRVSAEVYSYGKPGDMGFSLQPLAVQIIDLVEYGGRAETASDYGFDEEEGYVAPDEPEFGGDDGDDGDSIPSTSDDEDSPDY